MRDDGGLHPRTAALAAWYRAEARDLPWRAPPGAPRTDPYRVWLSEVMLQQTTVAAVRGYFARFTDRWPDVAALAAAEDGAVMAEWAGLGYYARARNLLACARVVAARGGFPDTEEALLALPGIGPYTAAAIAAIAFGRGAAVVDGNVERVISRLRAIETPLPASRPAIRAEAARLTPPEGGAVDPGDHAQAMMDLGATICTPRKPACMLCPLSEGCEGRARGLAADLPRKAPKVAKPTRRGIVYVARQGDDWLLERRPPKGLLGGTLGFPTTDWAEAPEPAPPFAAVWREAGTVRHTFTHFHLELSVMAARGAGNPDRGEWGPLAPGELPTLFRKVHAVAAG